MLSIFGLVAIIIVPILTYKTASSTGRNAVGWTLAAIGCGVGLQWIVPFFIGVVLAIVFMASGTSIDELPEKIAGFATFIGIFCFVLSIVGMWLILRRVSKVPDDEPAIAPPPPPPTFSSQE
jgi:putative Mn2+ efflux pump MntP